MSRATNTDSGWNYGKSTSTPIDSEIDDFILSLAHEGSMVRAGKTISTDNFPEYKQRLLALIEQACLEARVDEVKIAIQQTPVKFSYALDEEDVIAANKTIDAFREILNKRLAALLKEEK